MHILIIGKISGYNAHIKKESKVKQKQIYRNPFLEKTVALRLNNTHN
jgi:hypothetical protein